VILGGALLSCALAAPLSAQRGAVARVAVEPRRLELTVGVDTPVVIRLTDANGQELPADKTRLLATSSNGSVASARVSGDKALISAVGPGETEIKIEANRIFAYVRVSVDRGGRPAVGKTQPAVDIQVAERRLVLVPGEAAHVQPSGTTATGQPLPPEAFRFRSFEPSVAEVDSLTGEVRARAPGEGPVTISSPGSTVAAYVMVQVVPADLRLSADTILILQQESDTLRLIVPSQSRAYRGQPQFATGDAEVVEVDQEGIVSAQKPGSTTVRASVAGRDYTAVVTVFPRPKQWRLPAATEVPVTLPMGSSRPLVYTALTQDSAPMYQVPVKWTVQDTSIASFDQAGKNLTGRRVGATSITAEPLLRGTRIKPPFTWRVEVVGGRVSAEPARLGLRVRQTDSVRVTLLAPDGKPLDERPTLVWSVTGTQVVRSPGGDRFEGIATGRATLVGKTPWDSSATVLVFGVPDLLFSVADSGGRSVIAGLVNGTYHPDRLRGANAIDQQPVMSPDRTRIALISQRDARDTAHIWLMDADGLGAVQLTHGPGRDDRPTWSPDGSRVIFASARHGRYRLYSIRPDGSDLRPLTDSINPATRAAISPDGRWLVYESLRKQSYDLYRLPITRDLEPAGPEESLVATPDVERTPQFFSNGDLAYIRSSRDGKRPPVVVRTGRPGVPDEVLTPDTLRVLEFSITPDDQALIVAAPELGRPPSQARAVLYRVSLRSAGSPPEPLYKDPVGGVGSPSTVP
jgi:hypothetical protein